jgi:hypothetical protein
MPDSNGVRVSGGVVKAIGLLVAALVLATTFLLGLNAQFVPRTEWRMAEEREEAAGKATAVALSVHIDQTRLDSTRLSVIEVQLDAIQKQLDVIGNKIDRAALRTEKALK